VAEITRERTGQIIDTVLRVLAEHADGLGAAAAIAEVESRLPPTAFEETEYPSSPGTRRYEKVVRFSTITPVKAGWMTKVKGTWAITDEGRAILGRYADPADLAREAVRLYRQWKAGQPEPVDDVTAEDDASGTSAIALEEAEEAAWQEIARYLSEMPPYEFQQLIASLLNAMGYHIAWVSPPGPDQGIDIIASTDPLGASGPRIKVQVKRHQNKVAVDGIRSFMAVLGANDIGLFVCTGGFTSDALREARTQETRRITLFDAQQFFDLWVEYYDRLPEQSRQRLPLRPVYFLAPPD
jgi:restriction system protein